MNNRRFPPIILYIAALALVFSWLSGVFSTPRGSVTYSQVLDLFEQEQVRYFEMSGNTLAMVLSEPLNGKSNVTARIADPDGFRRDMKELLEAQRASGVLTGYDFLVEEDSSAFDLVLPLLIVGGVLLLAWAMMMGRMYSNNPLNNFGKARTVLGVPDGKKVTFADVAGADEEKEELQEIVDRLHFRKRLFDIKCCPHRHEP